MDAREALNKECSKIIKLMKKHNLQDYIWFSPEATSSEMRRFQDGGYKPETLYARQVFNVIMAGKHHLATRGIKVRRGLRYRAALKNLRLDEQEWLDENLEGWPLGHHFDLSEY